MIDAGLTQPMITRLSPIRCGRCGWPVSHMNKAVVGAEAGGLCTRCTKDEQGKRIFVYTYLAVAAPPDDRTAPA
jgi:hypothetical protein